MVVTGPTRRLVVREPVLPFRVAWRLEIDGAPALFGEPVEVRAGAVPIVVEATVVRPRLAARCRARFSVAVGAGREATVTIPPRRSLGVQRGSWVRSLRALG